MSYILFSSDNTMSLWVTNKSWNGTIEYSFDNREWKEWNGECLVNNTIYMRGINNTQISYFTENERIERWGRWKIQGTNVKCQGNIENLLDYKSVINNVHPKMDNYCFSYMFWDCHALTEASLGTISESSNSFYYMFDSCTSLTISPIFSNLKIFQETVINQHILDNCPIKKININNKLYNYDINIFKLL